MRASSTSLIQPESAPYFHIARHAVGVTTILVGSTAGLTVAVAQNTQPDQPTANEKDDQDEIVVTGARSVVNEKLGGSVQDAPQSINIISAKTLQEQAVTNLQDALKNIPGITLNAGEGIARGDTVNLRGFPAFNDFFLDGIRWCLTSAAQTMSLARAVHSSSNRHKI